MSFSKMVYCNICGFKRKCMTWIKYIEIVPKIGDFVIYKDNVREIIRNTPCKYEVINYAYCPKLDNMIIKSPNNINKEETIINKLINLA